LSNRKDERSGLYGLQVSEIKGESISIKELYGQKSLTKDEPIQNISEFLFSPDSKRIVFLAPDEKDAKEKDREKSGDDVEVFGKWAYSWEIVKSRAF
jgi:hypothetical protein